MGGTLGIRVKSAVDATADCGSGTLAVAGEDRRAQLDCYVRPLCSPLGRGNPKCHVATGGTKLGTVMLPRSPLVLQPWVLHNMGFLEASILRKQKSACTLGQRTEPVREFAPPTPLIKSQVRPTLIPLLRLPATAHQPEAGEPRGGTNCPHTYRHLARAL